MRASRVTIAATLVLLAGCTAADPEPGPTTPTTTTPPPLRAELTLPAASTTALPGLGAELALATSRALFARAPVVVLGPAEPSVAAASVAVALGAPLLQVAAPAAPTTDPDVAGATEPATAPGTPTVTGTSGPPAWQAEVARLGAEVLVVVDTAVDPVPGVALVGPEAAGLPGPVPVDGDPVLAVAALDRTRPTVLTAVPTDPGTGTAPAHDDLPAWTLADPAGPAVLLTDGDPGTLAAVATARAAGVPVVPVPGGDPRTASAAVAAAAPPGATVLAAGPALTALDPADLDARFRTAASGVQLPGGGQLAFAGKRMVALYGSPGIPALGLLGEQDAAAAATRAHDLAALYQQLTTETVVPAFEIIATIADREAGEDGNYSDERSVADLRPWVELAGEQGLYVVLDLQPGRTDFLTQAQAYTELLALPHVGLALDPEWRLEPDQVHLRQIGSVDVAEVNAVAAWLAELTRTRHLPQKVLVVHQFTDRMVQGRAALDTGHPELAVVLHVDGQGSQPAKAGTWAALQRDAPAGVAWGWKNFVDEDTPTATPEQTYAVVPTPVLVTYQ